MSAPDLAQAVAPAPHPTAARRPAPARAQNDSASFASILDAAPVADKAPVAVVERPTTPASAGSSEPLTDKAQEAEAATSADTAPADTVAVQPVLTPVLTPVVVPTQTATIDPGTSVPVQPTVPATPPLAEAETAPENGAEESAAADSPTESALIPLPAESSLPSRHRDVKQDQGSSNAASAQPTSDPGAATAAGSEGATKGQDQTSNNTKLADAGSSTPRPAIETTSGVGPATSESAEPGQTLSAGTTPEARSADAAAPTPVLSTLSHGAIHATAQIAAQIVKKLEARSTRFEMALTPDDLGRVDVSLDIDSDGQLSARLAFDNPLAAADLRGRVDELRRQLTDAGFTVAEDALSFDQREPSAGSNGFDRSNDRQSARAFGAASRLSLEADVGLVPPRWMSLTLAPERVDMKV